MQKIATIPISKEGQGIAQVLENQLDARRLLRSDVDKEWKAYDAFIFIGAMGICVRTIAPLVEDKHADPAVVCVDSSGQHAISVLSGHIGGAATMPTYGRSTPSDNSLAGMWPMARG